MYSKHLSHCPKHITQYINRCLNADFCFHEVQLLKIYFLFFEGSVMFPNSTRVVSADLQSVHAIYHPKEYFIIVNFLPIQKFRIGMILITNDHHKSMSLFNKHILL